MGKIYIAHEVLKLKLSVKIFKFCLSEADHGCRAHSTPFMKTYPRPSKDERIFVIIL